MEQPQNATSTPPQAPARILFYSTKGKYGPFSNFARYPITIQGIGWPTTEHFYQAAKFAGTPYADQVRQSATPTAAAAMGRRRDLPLRKDWDHVKEVIMMRALRAKFTQHSALRELLLGTGAAELVEHTSNDRYWADGGDGSGANRLGALLMQLRTELRQS